MNTGRGCTSQRILTKGFIVLLALFSVCVAVPAHAAAPGPLPGDQTQTTSNTKQRVYAQQDPAWVQKKNTHQITRAGSHKMVPLLAIPPSYMLDTTVVQYTLEPSGQGSDEANMAYYDQNMWRLCVPGSATNALNYWGKPLNYNGTHQFYDSSDRLTTTWNDYFHRSYLMHLAWQIQLCSHR